MTSHPDPRPTEPPSTSGFYGWIESLKTVRSADRWVGGVVAGIADRLEIDRTLARGIMVVAIFVTAGLALLFYGLCWALLPEPDGRIHAREASAGRWTSGMTGATVFTAIGLIDLMTFPFNDGSWRGPGTVIGLAILGVFVWLILSCRDPHRRLPGGVGPHPDARNVTTPEGTGSASRPAGSVHLAPSSTDWYGTTSAPSGSGSTVASSGASGAGEQNPWFESEDGSTLSWDPPADDSSDTPGETWGNIEPVDPTERGDRQDRRERRWRDERYDAVAVTPRERELSMPGSFQAAVVGLAMLAGAAVGLLKYLEVFTAPWPQIWVAAGATTLAVMALGVLYSAIRGRTGGGLTVGTAILTGAVLLTTSGDLIRTDVTFDQVRGDADSGYELSFGTQTIDLSQVSVSDGGERTIPLNLSFAEATVLLPDGVDVELTTDSSFSTVRHPRPGEAGQTSTSDDLDRLLVVDVPDPEAGTLVLEADASFSTLHLTADTATVSLDHTGA